MASRVSFTVGQEMVEGTEAEGVYKRCDVIMVRIVERCPSRVSIGTNLISDLY